MDSSNKNYIFIDNGYDSMKCAHFSTNIYHEFDYFEIPSIMLDDICETKTVDNVSVYCPTEGLRGRANAYFMQAPS